jgi:cystathionine beta-synthase
VVTVLPDAGTRYITKFLSDAWMRDYGFLGSDRDLGLVEDILRAMPAHPVYTAGPRTPVSEVIHTFKSRGVSQVPIVDAQGHPSGMVHEVDVLRGLQSGEVTPDSPASKVSHAIGGLIYPKARVEELFRIFETDQVGVVVDNGKIAGIVSKIDVLEFLARTRR